MERTRIPGLSSGKRHPDWQALYRSAKAESLPWHYTAMDPDILAALGGARQGLLLDIGCGLGNQAALLHELGFSVTATDIAEAAIDRARELYPDVDFRVDDIMNSKVGAAFDFVIDRGCFHVLASEQHAAYAENIHCLLKPSATFLLKVFSDESGPGDFGPHRYSPAKLKEIFSDHFKIQLIEHTTYQGSTANPPKAWLAVMQPKEKP
jgi:SAM-dependent methyltransferase